MTLSTTNFDPSSLLSGRYIINDPEYLIDLNVDLHFTYDKSNREAHEKFVVNQPDHVSPKTC